MSDFGHLPSFCSLKNAFLSVLQFPIDSQWPSNLQCICICQQNMHDKNTYLLYHLASFIKKATYNSLKNKYLAKIVYKCCKKMRQPVSFASERQANQTWGNICMKCKPLEPIQPKPQRANAWIFSLPREGGTCSLGMPFVLSLLQFWTFFQCRLGRTGNILLCSVQFFFCGIFSFQFVFLGGGNFLNHQQPTFVRSEGVSIAYSVFSLN